MSDQKSKIQVLIVDDDEMIRDFLGIFLQENFDIRKAGNGQEAYNILKESNFTEPPDVVILDINMPVMNGIELLQELRSKKCMIPVIVISGLPEYQIENLNVFDVMSKPIDLKRLESNIYAAIELDESNIISNSLYALSKARTFVNSIVL